MKKITLFTLGAALIAVPALAAPGGKMGDADGDGVLTRAEAQAAATQMFAKMDANGDGQLDATDRATKRAERGEKHAEAGEGHRGKRDGMRGHRGKRGGHGMMMMARADTDGDKAISQAEFQTAALARFDSVDANKDGQVTADERKAHRETMRAKRGQRAASQ